MAHLLAKFAFWDSVDIFCNSHSIPRWNFHILSLRLGIKMCLLFMFNKVCGISQKKKKNYVPDCIQ